MASDSSDEEDYVFVGTSLQDEEDTIPGQYRKTAAEPASTRLAPVWQQEATDDQGRRRFHGAFTGGFSAGYFNTVGSKVGTYCPKLSTQYY
jgi:G patch domain-containing protein 1